MTRGLYDSGFERLVNQCFTSVQGQLAIFIQWFSFDVRKNCFCVSEKFSTLDETSEEEQRICEEPVKCLTCGTLIEDRLHRLPFPYPFRKAT